MEEIWKDIPGYEGLYQVSNLGNVKSADRDRRGRNNKIRHCKGRMLKMRISNKGYAYVLLFDRQNNDKSIAVHRIVAKVFIPVPDEYRHLIDAVNNIGSPILEVNHKDENPLNNCVDNLEWCDRVYNVNYGTAIKRAQKKKGYPVMQFDLQGNYITTFVSLKEAARQTNGSDANIRRACLGKYKQSNGYIWKYDTRTN